MKQEQAAARIAASYINNTDCHVFLTGKAGTGKTTFLREIVSRTHKNCVVAAPTGVAAINAGGVTLHSLFQLPFGTFIPENQGLFSGSMSSEVNTPDSLKKKLKINSVKRQMLREMELLIIDEVSMLRADILDEIDLVLRIVRRRQSMPFGGVQLLMIGDMLQLPPVVKNNEWPLLSRFYRSAYFFDALVLQQSKPVYVELEKIYRQTDQQFISLLAHIRENKLDAADIKLLNTFYKEKLSKKEKDGAVFLTTHNRQADEINNKHLSELDSKAYRYHAEVSDDFPEYYFPVEETLVLKEGAQVMFIKNDYSGEQRYYNGKIGVVEHVDEDTVFVQFNDGSESVEVEPYIWENKRYTMNQETGNIEEEVLGSFKHLPLKLAWAITIHKSQGLTFDKAIIDVSKAFAPGQIYVALSRLRSLQGLILTRPLNEDGISPDNRLKEYAGNKQDEAELKARLKSEAFGYLRNFLLRSFDFNELEYQLRDHVRSYNKQEGKSEKQKHKSWAVNLAKKIEEPKKTAAKFNVQLQKLTFSERDASLQKIAERVESAKNYFEPILNEFNDSINEHLSSLGHKRGIKRYTTELKNLDTLFYNQIKRFYKAQELIKSLIEDRELTKKDVDAVTGRLQQRRIESKSETEKKAKKTGKEKQKQQKKGSSAALSFEMYKQENKTLEEIAIERQLAISTIEGHLAQYVAKGELPARDFVDEKKYAQIIQAYKVVDSSALGAIMSVLGDEFTYTDVRFAMAGYFSEQEAEKTGAGEESSPDRS